MIAAGLLIGSVPAGAQARKPSAPVQQPQIGGIAPAPAPRPRDGGYGRRHEGPGYGGGHGRGYPYAPVTYGWVPAIIGADGRVWVNLGYGYEPVIRSCAAQYGAGFENVYSYTPEYSQPSYTPPTYTPPSYTPPSYSTPSYPAPVPTGSQTGTQPAPDPSSHAPPGMAPAPGMPPAPGAAPAPGNRVIRYSYPARDHRGVASCYVTRSQGQPVVLWR